MHCTVFKAFMCPVPVSLSPSSFCVLLTIFLLFPLADYFDSGGAERQESRQPEILRMRSSISPIRASLFQCPLLVQRIKVLLMFIMAE